MFGFCSDEYISEQQCVATGVWGIPAATGDDNCVDGCCRTHDHCCGAGTDRAVCNKNIVECIDRYHCGGLCADAVHVALKIVSSFCCGSRCPSFSADEHGNYVPMNLAGKSFCSVAENGKEDPIKLSFSDSHQKSENADVSLFKVNIQNCDDASSLDAALHQGSNRIVIGSTNLDEADKMHGLSPSCSASSPLLEQLSANSKFWYFPNTEELFAKNGKTDSYFTLNKC